MATLADWFTRARIDEHIGWLSRVRDAEISAPEFAADSARFDEEPGRIRAEALLFDGVISNDHWLSGARLRGCAFERCALESGHWDFIEFEATRFEQTTFTSMNLQRSTWRECSFRGVRFESCDLRDADLSTVQTHAVTLVGCDLRGATLPKPWSATLVECVTT